jgi:hypothetical protein
MKIMFIIWIPIHLASDGLPARFTSGCSIEVARSTSKGELPRNGRGEFLRNANSGAALA